MNAAPSTPATAPFVAFASLLGVLEADATRRHAARQSGEALGPVTGLPALDRILGDHLEAGLHVVHGQPGTGKSALALQIAATCGCPALLVTTEMAPLELLRRHCARVTDTFLGKFKSGELPPATVLSLAQKAVGAAPQLALLDATLAPAPAASILENALALRERFGSAHVLIVVDSVHSWAARLDLPAGIAEYDRLTAALGALQDIALSLSCPILAVAEKNRASRESSGQSASAGTRKFEFSAQSVLGLSTRTEADLPETNPDDTIDVRVTVSKNRSGACGRVDMVFDPRIQRFADTEGAPTL